jgi:hypothetical protein
VSGTRSGLLRWLTIAAISLAATVAIPLDLLPWLRGPAPYPPEWQWGYRTGGPIRPLVIAGALAAVVLALLAATGGRWARRRPRAAAITLLAAATVAAWGLQIAVLERDPAGPLRALMARALSPSISSYHAAAVEEERDPEPLLAAHAAALPILPRTAKHAATHPPGLVLFYRGAIALCERSPALTDAILRIGRVPRRASQTGLGRAEHASALLGALALGAFAVLTLWPLAFLAEALGLEPLAAARVGLLWTLVPAFVVMSPAHDAAIALPVTACALLLARASAATSRRELLASGALAGACGGVALFASYASMAFLGIAVLAVAAAASVERRGVARALVASAVAAAVAALLAFGVPAALGGEPLRVMRAALNLHRAAFTSPRSYALWLLFNPLDLAVFVGLPVAVAGLWAAGRAARRAFAKRPLVAIDRFRLGVFAGVTLLLLSGTVRGEVGRILIPLMPLVLLGSVADDSPALEAGEALGLGALVAPLMLVIAEYWIV